MNLFIIQNNQHSVKDTVKEKKSVFIPENYLKQKCTNIKTSGVGNIFTGSVFSFFNLNLIT